MATNPCAAGFQPINSRGDEMDASLRAPYFPPGVTGFRDWYAHCRACDDPSSLPVPLWRRALFILKSWLVI